MDQKKFVLRHELLYTNDIREYFTLDEKYQLYQEGIFLSEVLCILMSSKELERAYGDMAFSRQFVKAAMSPAEQVRYLQNTENRLELSLHEKIQLYNDGHLSLEFLYEKCSLSELLQIAVKGLLEEESLHDLLGPKLLPLQMHGCTTIQELLSLQEEELRLFTPDLFYISEEEAGRLFSPLELTALLQTDIAPTFLRFLFIKWLPKKERESKIEEAKANISWLTRQLSYTATIKKTVVTYEFMKRVLQEYLVNFTQIPHPEDGNAGTA